MTTAPSPLSFVQSAMRSLLHSLPPSQRPHLLTSSHVTFSLFAALPTTLLAFRIPRLSLFPILPAHSIPRKRRRTENDGANEIGDAPDFGPSGSGLLLPSEDTLDVISGIRREIEKLPDTHRDYSDPRVILKLPFPSICEIPERFCLNDVSNRYISYFGREKFADIWKLYEEVKKDIHRRRAIYVYGTMGYGKSHILAALACLLTRKGERVIYLPDCRAACQHFDDYLRKTLLFTFTSREERAAIMSCRTTNNMLDFCRSQKELVIIYDQSNALDPEEQGKDYVPNKTKEIIHLALKSLSSGQISVTSASANHKTARHMGSKPTNEKRIALMGGMTSVEMENWWKRYAEDFKAFTVDQRNRIEDLTGCIPLLLVPFLGHPSVGLDDLEPEIWNHPSLNFVVIEAAKFGLRWVVKPEFKIHYVTLMRSCLLHTEVTAIDDDLLDNRFCFRDKQQRMQFACGLARQAIVRLLRGHKQESVFLGPEWYRVFEDFKDNPSVMGFMVEQFVLGKLAVTGLPACNLNAAPVVPVTGTTITLDTTMDIALYIPLSFNFKAIDALHVLLDKTNMIAHVTGIQITISKFYHRKNCEEAFFAGWEQLVSILKSFTIKASFVWIYRGVRGQKEVPEDVLLLRSKSIQKHPEYLTRYVAVDQVDPDLARILER